MQYYNQRKSSQYLFYSLFSVVAILLASIISLYVIDDRITKALAEKLPELQADIANSHKLIQELNRTNEATYTLLLENTRSLEEQLRDWIAQQFALNAEVTNNLVQELNQIKQATNGKLMDNTRNMEESLRGWIGSQIALNTENDPHKNRAKL